MRIRRFLVPLTFAICSSGAPLPGQPGNGKRAAFALHSELTAIGPDLTSRPETISGVSAVVSETEANRAALFAEIRPSEEKHVRWSAEYSSPFAFVSAGSRFLPGPPTDFLRLPYAVPASLGIEPARASDSAWVSLFPGMVPGLFALESERSLGVFYAAGNDVLAAVHPGARVGVIAIRRSFAGPSARTDLVTDILFNRRTTEGFASLVRRPDLGGWTMESTAERREKNDYKNFETKELLEKRKGRSGFGSLYAAWDDFVFAEAAGEDRGMAGARLAGLGIALPSADVQLVVRPRVMRESVYGGPENRRTWESVAVGLRFWGKKGRFFAAVESKRHGTRGIETGATLRTRPVDIDVGFAAQETGGKLTPSPLYMPGGVEMETRPKFFFSRKSAFFARVRSSFFQCSISLGEDLSGKRTALTSAELRVGL